MCACVNWANIWCNYVQTRATRVPVLSAHTMREVIENHHQPAQQIVAQSTGIDFEPVSALQCVWDVYHSIREGKIDFSVALKKKHPKSNVYSLIIRWGAINSRRSGD